MARLFEPNEEQLAEWEAWKDGQPEVVLDLVRRFPPWELYWLDPPGQRVTLVSYSEDGTVTVSVSGQFNPFVIMDRQVFGIDPKNLTPCDIPPPEETMNGFLSAIGLGDTPQP